MTLGAVGYVVNELTAETQKLIGKMSVTPPQGRSFLIDQVIRDLQQGGVWGSLDVLYIFAAHVQQAALLNWKDPATFTGSAVNSPTFTTDVGFTGNGSTAYIDSTFNATTANGLFAQNSGHLSAWSKLVAADSAGICGTLGALGSGNSYITPRFTGDNHFSEINSASVGGVAQANTDGSGFWVTTRSTSTVTDAYRNGDFFDTNDAPGTSAAPGNTTMIFLGEAANRGSAQLTMGSIGGNLSSSQIKVFYQAVRKYMISVGAVI